MSEGRADSHGSHSSWTTNGQQMNCRSRDIHAKTLWLGVAHSLWITDLHFHFESQTFCFEQRHLAGFKNPAREAVVNVEQLRLQDTGSRCQAILTWLTRSHLRAHMCMCMRVEGFDHRPQRMRVGCVKKYDITGPRKCVLGEWTAGPVPSICKCCKHCTGGQGAHIQRHTQFAWPCTGYNKTNSTSRGASRLGA